MAPALRPLAFVGVVALLTLMLAAGPFAAPRVVAQEPTAVLPWEYSPYRITVWLAWSDAPDSSPRLKREVAECLVRQCEAHALSEWNVAVEPVPAALRVDVLQTMSDVTAEQVLAAEPEVLSGDKLMLVHVVAEGGGWHVAARELDCRTRFFGATVERRAEQRELLGLTVFEAIVEAFRPVGRIDRTDEIRPDGARVRVARVRIRGGGLATDERSPVYIPDGAVLRPIIRRNDRQGNPRPGGIIPIPLTLLEVMEPVRWDDDAAPTIDSSSTAVPEDGASEGDNNSTDTSGGSTDEEIIASVSSPADESAHRGRGSLNCEIHSGIRGALGSRSSRRVEQYALLAKPAYPSTELRLQTAGSASRPLAGYDIYARPESEEDKSELVGRTDWRGALDVPPADKPLRVLYVKSGGRLLARIPMVPGLDREVTVDVPDDDLRLEAESVVAGLEGYIMDAVVQRELVVARIRRDIAEGKFDEADQRLAKLRSFERPADLERLLVRQERRFVGATADPKGRIAPMFADARGLLNKFLNPSLPQQLAQELQEARRAGSSSSDTSSDPADDATDDGDDST